MRELYGPLRALITVNESLWQGLRATNVPAAMVRHSGGTRSIEDDETWHRWVESVLMPTNRQMQELILGHADLLIEEDMPEPLLTFCAHVSSYEVLLADRAHGVRTRGPSSIIPAPPTWSM